MNDTAFQSCLRSCLGLILVCPSILGQEMLPQEFRLDTTPPDPAMTSLDAKLRERASWDWTKTNRALAAEHGLSEPCIYQWRKRLGKSKPFRYLQVDVTGWNWALSDSALGRQHKLPLHTVRQCRLHHNAPPSTISERRPRFAWPPRPTGRSSKVNWQTVDWSKLDITIAKEIGVSREWVRQKRIALGKPKTFRMNVHAKEFAEFVQNKPTVTSKDFKAFGICSDAGRRYCQIAGIKVVRLEPPRKWPCWNVVNWNLPNACLAAAWQKPAQRFATKRYQRGQPSVRWRMVEGKIPPEHQAEFDAECRKAAEWLEKNK